MTSPINKIVQSISDSESAQIKLTTGGGNQLRLKCIYKEDIPPYFYLIFPPKTLPENIDQTSNYPVLVRHDNSTISLSSRVVEQKGDRTLYLMAKSTLDPSSLREYFRINISTPITISYESVTREAKSTGWEISGTTQDLSGSGVLALFDDEPKNKNNIFIEITFPEKKVTVRTVAHIIRKKLLRNRRWQISFHFDNISSSHRDIIITNLFSEQRKQLREKIHTRD